MCMYQMKHSIYQFSSVQSLSRVRLFATPWIAARQASLSITNSQSSPRLTSIESVMSSSHLILCHPLLLLPPIPPSIRVFSNKSALHIAYIGFSIIIVEATSVHLGTYSPQITEGGGVLIKQIYLTRKWGSDIWRKHSHQIMLLNFGERTKNIC